MGAEARILFGAIVTSDGGSVEIGSRCVVMENAVIRGAPGHAARLGDNVLAGPRAYFTGCTIEDNVFLQPGRRSGGNYMRGS